MSPTLNYYRYNINQVNKHIEKLLKQRDSIHILDAGCGGTSRFNYGEGKAFIEGIDISPVRMDNNEQLDKKILGDIQTFKLPPCHYDIIVCWNVLEHLPNPEKALANFSQSLKQGGLMIIGVPNRRSFKGLITKYTPHIFHRLVFKYIYKRDVIPIPTFFSNHISPNALLKFADDSNLTVEWINFYHISPFSNFSAYYKDRKAFLLAYSIYFVFGLIVNVITFGQISVKKTELALIYRKKNT